MSPSVLVIILVFNTAYLPAIDHIDMPNAAASEAAKSSFVDQVSGFGRTVEAYCIPRETLP